jgi:hypothetical protein
VDDRERQLPKPGRVLDDPARVAGVPERVAHDPGGVLGERKRVPQLSGSLAALHGGAQHAALVARVDRTEERLTSDA